MNTGTSTKGKRVWPPHLPHKIKKYRSRKIVKAVKVVGLHKSSYDLKFTGKDGELVKLKPTMGFPAAYSNGQHDIGEGDNGYYYDDRLSHWEFPSSKFEGKYEFVGEECEKWDLYRSRGIALVDKIIKINPPYSTGWRAWEYYTESGTVTNIIPHRGGVLYDLYSIDELERGDFGYRVTSGGTTRVMNSDKFHEQYELVEV